MKIIECLSDIKCANIEVINNDVVLPLGKEVYNKLLSLKSAEGIKGVYFTHYTSPPAGYPHVRVGFRFENFLKVKPTIENFLNNLSKKLIKDIPLLESTIGIDRNYPKDVISDYVICDSFDFLIKLDKEMEEKYKKSENIIEFVSNWFLKNKENFFKDIVFKYEKEVGRSFNNEELYQILERVIHHILNSGLSYANLLLSVEKQIFQNLISLSFFKK